MDNGKFNIHGRVQLLKNFLASKGFKSTKQRNAILNIFVQLEDYLNVEEIYKKVKHRVPKIGFTTVYRTIKLLEKNGFAIKTYLRDGHSHYEPHFDTSSHHYFICTKCGETMKDENTNLSDRIHSSATEHQFNLHHYKLEITGLCKSCQKPIN